MRAVLAALCGDGSPSSCSSLWVMAVMVFNIPLARGRGIAQALRHDGPLKKPERSFARGFVNIILLYRDLIIRHR